MNNSTTTTIKDIHQALYQFRKIVNANHTFSFDYLVCLPDAYELITQQIRETYDFSYERQQFPDRIYGMELHQAQNENDGFELLEYFSKRKKKAVLAKLVDEIVWQFPKDRFIEYGPEDEWWARKLNFGKEVKTGKKNLVLVGPLPVLDFLPMPDYTSGFEFKAKSYVKSYYDNMPTFTYSPTSLILTA